MYDIDWVLHAAYTHTQRLIGGPPPVYPSSPFIEWAFLHRKLFQYFDSVRPQSSLANSTLLLALYFIFKTFKLDDSMQETTFVILPCIEYIVIADNLGCRRERGSLLHCRETSLLTDVFSPGFYQVFSKKCELMNGHLNSFIDSNFISLFSKEIWFVRSIWWSNFSNLHDSGIQWLKMTCSDKML